MRVLVLIGLTIAATFMLPSFAQNLIGKNNTKTTHSTVVSRIDQAIANTVQTSATGLPSRGMTMQQVERDFGTPETRKAPVGDPPITRWEYGQFIVYFEYRHVIHAVNRR